MGQASVGTVSFVQPFRPASLGQPPRARPVSATPLFAACQSLCPPVAHPQRTVAVAKRPVEQEAQRRSQGRVHPPAASPCRSTCCARRRGARRFRARGAVSRSAAWDSRATTIRWPAASSPRAGVPASALAADPGGAQDITAMVAGLHGHADRGQADRTRRPGPVTPRGGGALAPRGSRHWPLSSIGCRPPSDGCS